MARSFCFPSKYLPLVESYISMAMHDIGHDQRVRARIADGHRSPHRMPVPAAYVDEQLRGNMVIVPAPAESQPDDASLAMRIADIVAAPDFLVLRSNTGIVSVTAYGDTVVGSTAKGCVIGLILKQSGAITDLDLDGREDGTQVAAMGAR